MIVGRASVDKPSHLPTDQRYCLGHRIRGMAMEDEYVDDELVENVTECPGCGILRP